MLGLAILFFIIAILAMLLGNAGIAGMSAEIGKWLLIVFIILALVFGVLGGFNYHTGHGIFAW